MKVLGIYGSPRKGGNSDMLLDKVLEGAKSSGARLVSPVYARRLKMSGCVACGGCDDTGECIVDDDMQKVYPLLDEADIIFLASPVYFYALTAQAKALVDRSQARWNRKLLFKKKEDLKRHDSGVGYLVSVGATRGKKLFDCVGLEAKYFFDALDMDYRGALLFSGIEDKGEVKGRADALTEAFEFGRSAVEDFRKV